MVLVEVPPAFFLHIFVSVIENAYDLVFLRVQSQVELDCLFVDEDEVVAAFLAREQLACLSQVLIKRAHKSSEFSEEDIA